METKVGSEGLQDWLSDFGGFILSLFLVARGASMRAYLQNEAAEAKTKVDS